MKKEYLIAGFLTIFIIVGLATSWMLAIILSLIAVISVPILYKVLSNFYEKKLIKLGEEYEARRKNTGEEPRRFVGTNKTTSTEDNIFRAKRNKSLSNLSDGLPSTGDDEVEERGESNRFDPV